MFPVNVPCHHVIEMLRLLLVHLDVLRTNYKITVNLRVQPCEKAPWKHPPTPWRRAEFVRNVETKPLSKLLHGSNRKFTHSLLLSSKASNITHLHVLFHKEYACPSYQSLLYCFRANLTLRASTFKHGLLERGLCPWSTARTFQCYKLYRYSDGFMWNMSFSPRLDPRWVIAWPFGQEPSSLLGRITEWKHLSPQSDCQKGFMWPE